MRLIFMGTPDFACPALGSLRAAGHVIAAVYSQPPRPAGRGLELVKSPVHKFAEARGLQVRTPLNFKEPAERTEFAAFNADAVIVVAYGMILPSSVLAVPRLGCFNIHASKLPRWRGAAPIQRAIMSGDPTTGVSIMRMERGLDTGPVSLLAEVDIEAGKTAGELHDELAWLGSALIVQAMPLIEAGLLIEKPQSEDGVTYAAKIDKSETRINFNRPARDVAAHINGLSPSPAAWFNAAPLNGPTERIRALRAFEADGEGDAGIVLDNALTIACGNSAIRLADVQRPGKRPVPAEEFLRGFALEPGTKLT